MDQRKLALDRRTVRRHLLTGFLVCSKCGARLKGGQGKDHRGEQEPRYACPPPGVGNLKGCGGVVVGGRRADETVMGWVFDYLDSPELSNSLARAAKPSDGSIGRIVEALENDRARRADVGGLHAGGDIDREYLRRTEKLRARIDGNEKNLSRVASVPRIRYVGQGDRLRRAQGQMTFEERRDVLEAVLDYVEVHPARRAVPRFQPERLVPHFRY